MKVDFYLRFHTRFGERLSVIGNFPATGTACEEREYGLQYLNEEFWHLSLDIEKLKGHTLRYRYLFINEAGDVIPEAEKERVFCFDDHPHHRMTFVDTWNDSSTVDNTFYTAPFREVL